MEKLGVNDKSTNNISRLKEYKDDCLVESRSEKAVKVVHYTYSPPLGVIVSCGFPTSGSRAKKSFAKGELTNKVLRCLDRNWQPKVTTIMEPKDLDSIPLATLFGNLQEHEMELRRLILYEESNKRKKGISLKASTSQTQEKRVDEAI
ncbi:hypothetical protein Lal_00035404 [Lupinus albus]|nr:hypothetical protein Lal_00035404 [Lupinus albus]